MISLPISKTPSRRRAGPALLLWLSGVIAARLRPHVAVRLADIRALLESGA